MDLNLTEFLKPINLVFLVIALASLLFAIITYLWSRHEAAISYHTATIQVVDQNEALPLSVLDSDNQRVTENVYAATVTVWNSGDLPIDPQNVRSPLVVNLSSNESVIDAKLEYTTDNNISEFHIVGTPKKNTFIQINWRYFDPREGFRLRIIYVGKNISPVTLAGVIFGVNGFSDITVSKNEASPFKRPSYIAALGGMIVITVSSIITIIFGQVILANANRETDDTKKQRLMKRREIIKNISLAIQVIGSGAIVLGIWMGFPSRPPF